MYRNHHDSLTIDQPDNFGSHNYTSVAEARKARHLHGISLRNVSLPRNAFRASSISSDDLVLSNSAHSPARSLGYSNKNALLRSRSFPNLGSLEIQDLYLEGTLYPSPLDNFRNFEKSKMRVKRRATLDWSSTMQIRKQEQISEAVARRMADVFITLHLVGYEEPFYISEVVKRTMNPNFRFFDLKHCGGLICNRTNLELRAWMKPHQSNRWHFLLQSDFNLKFLQFLGKSVDNLQYSLPANTVIFHLADGTYIANPEKLAISHSVYHSKTVYIPSQSGSQQAERTSSFDALSRLQALYECIKDVTSTHKNLATHIESLLTQSDSSFANLDDLKRRKDTLARLRGRLSIESHSVSCMRDKVSALKSGIKIQLATNQKCHEAQLRANEKLESGKLMVEASWCKHRQCADRLRNQRRRVCEDLLKIYQINPMLDRPLAFTICSIPLTNSDFTNPKEDEVGAAMGYVAHVVHMLFQYLCISLPYPITPRESSSLICDPISATLPITASSRIFPLYIKGSLFYRFEYGVYLLNKDIECLATNSGLRLMDIRQTLANLKYVLFVVTAGKGDLPSRRVGGIRGLLRDQGK